MSTGKMISSETWTDTLSELSSSKKLQHSQIKTVPDPQKDSMIGSIRGTGILLLILSNKHFDKVRMINAETLLTLISKT